MVYFNDVRDRLAQNSVKKKRKKNTCPEPKKKTTAVWNWFSAVRFPRDLFDRYATIPAELKCTLTLP